MVNKKITVLVLMVTAVIAVALAGCTSPTPTPAPEATPTPAPTAAPEGTVALTIEGKVANQLDLTMDVLKSYEQMTISVLGKDNVTQNYTGVSFNKLLDDAAPTTDATMVNMTGSDGYNYAIDLSKIRAQPDAIIAINEDNSLKAVIPNESKGAWVGNLVLIVVE
jgi:DMSO/TMAO reductase YedYZ molybdopterin-dependent catalytic subunit